MIIFVSCIGVIETLSMPIDREWCRRVSTVVACGTGCSGMRFF